jgi:hypothetical protein
LYNLKIVQVYNFTIFKLRSTTEQMPALVQITEIAQKVWANSFLSIDCVRCLPKKRLG